MTLLANPLSALATLHVDPRLAVLLSIVAALHADPLLANPLATLHADPRLASHGSAVTAHLSELLAPPHAVTALRIDLLLPVPLRMQSRLCTLILHAVTAHPSRSHGSAPLLPTFLSLRAVTVHPALSRNHGCPLRAVTVHPVTTLHIDSLPSHAESPTSRALCSAPLRSDPLRAGTWRCSGTALSLLCVVLCYASTTSSAVGSIPQPQNPAALLADPLSALATLHALFFSA